MAQNSTMIWLGLGAVAAYFGYEWYYGPGGQADQAACADTAAGGTAPTASQLADMAQGILNAAQAQNITPAAYIAAQPATTAANVLACARVAIATYPTLASLPAPGASTLPPPSSWTGTAAAWAAMTSAQQSAWLAMNVNQQLPTNVVTPVPAPSASATGGNVAVAPVNSMTLASLAAAIQAQSAGDGNLVNGAMSGDHWNTYANLITGKTLPGGWPSGNITFAQYWATQSPVIAAATGLGSIMAGLGALVRARGGRWGMGDYVPSSTDPFSMTADTAGDSSVPYARVGHVADIDWN